MAVIKIVPMPGAEGQQGETGAVGPQGPQGETGATGPAGADAVWYYNGEYNPGASYVIGDVVTYDGQLWYRKNANGGNVGDTPSEGLFWDLLAAKGDNANVADFEFSQPLPHESVMRIHNHDMVIMTTSDVPGSDADITINSADDLWVFAQDTIRISSQDNAELLANTTVRLQGQNGEFLKDSTVPSNQIATLGDITAAVGVGNNGEVTRWSPNFKATGLVFTGTDSAYPTYNSHYVKNGRMVSFWIEIDLATVTNFGTGQYIAELPFMPLTGTMNHFQAWANVDPAVNPDIAGHVVLQADHLANTKDLDLHYLKQAGGANSPLMEAMFKQGTPATLTTSSKIYINGTYITAE